MKKILCVLLTVLLLVSMTACGSAKMKSGVEDGVLTIAME